MRRKEKLNKVGYCELVNAITLGLVCLLVNGV